DVHGPADRPRATELGRRAAAGVERELVDREVEDVRIVPEDVLGAIAVVNVPVEDRDPGGALGARGGRGDRDVVEQAESHRAIARGVVTGRAYDRDAVRELAVQDVDGELHGRSGRGERGVPGAGREVGVGVEPARLSGHGVREVVEVIRRV